MNSSSNSIIRRRRIWKSSSRQQSRRGPVVAFRRHLALWLLLCWTSSITTTTTTSITPWSTAAFLTVSPVAVVRQQWQVQAAIWNNLDNNNNINSNKHVPRSSSTSTTTSSSTTPTTLSSSSSSSSSESDTTTAASQRQPQQQQYERDVEQNSVYLRRLIMNLGNLCDKYIMNGSPMIRERIFNVLDQIEMETVLPDNEHYIRQSLRTVKRAGVPMHKTYLEKFERYNTNNDSSSDNGNNGTIELGKTDSSVRRQNVQNRQEWEQQQNQQQDNTNDSLNGGGGGGGGGKSALTRRAQQQKENVFMPSVLNPDDIATIATDKENLQKAMMTGDNSNNVNANDNDNDNNTPNADSSVDSVLAAGRVSQMIARAGSGGSFDGNNLGIGGLDDVLLEIKRRIWTPLAAPPSLLQELGIHPVRGLLLYGKPGCGKTLLASTVGSMLSPFRPITVVSGPEVLDKFVGSSEKNLREIFDNPPDIYDKYRINEPDNGNSIASHALHVVVMDEFDAIARSRGGQDGKGGQGDAGVARDSVVNQLLAKMDGVVPLPVPTLVIGLTNKRSLIEPALLRPGRFEVQIEIPPPRTIEQRVSILRVHTQSMYEAGRLEVSDPPTGTAAARHLSTLSTFEGLLPYNELLTKLAVVCEGFSGASLAAVARAAASHALERAVQEFTSQLDETTNGDGVISPASSSLVEDTPTSIMNCLVTQDDFDEAIQDVRNSMGTHDHTDDADDDDKDNDKNSNIPTDATAGQDVDDDDDDDPVKP